MKKKIRIKFTNFWPQFMADYHADDDREWLFSVLLHELYDVEIVDEDPDYLIYSAFGGTDYKSDLYKDAVKVFYSGENNQKNLDRFRHADFSLSHHFPNDPIFGEYINTETHLILPIYVRVFGPEKLKEIAHVDVDKVIKRKNKFCCLITRNTDAKDRVEFFRLLSNTYKKVDSAGRAYNNMADGYEVPGWWMQSYKFAREYKFMINIENDVSVHKHPGYTSEKLFNGLRAETVPLYSGNPNVDLLFNPEAFINLDDFDSWKEAIEYIRYVDNNEEEYRYILNSSRFYGGDPENHDVDCYKKEKIVEFIKKIFD